MCCYVTVCSMCLDRWVYIDGFIYSRILRCVFIAAMTRIDLSPFEVSQKVPIPVVRANTKRGNIKSTHFQTVMRGGGCRQGLEPPSPLSLQCGPGLVADVAMLDGLERTTTACVVPHSIAGDRACETRGTAPVSEATTVVGENDCSPGLLLALYMCCAEHLASPRSKARAFLKLPHPVCFLSLPPSHFLPARTIAPTPASPPHLQQDPPAPCTPTSPPQCVWLVPQTVSIRIALQ